MRSIRGIVKQVYGRKGRIGRVWLRHRARGGRIRDSGERSRMRANTRRDERQKTTCTPWLLTWQSRTLNQRIAGKGGGSW
jgi:hypothetical protein